MIRIELNLETSAIFRILNIAFTFWNSGKIIEISAINLISLSDDMSLEFQDFSESEILSDYKMDYIFARIIVNLFLLVLTTNLRPCIDFHFFWFESY